MDKFSLEVSLKLLIRPTVKKEDISNWKKDCKLWSKDDDRTLDKVAVHATVNSKYPS
jgi:hypothetical protein